jgi:glucose-6-phosphate 1-epimerase
MIRLTHSSATAEIHSHGAHVTSWRPSSGDERLFLSSRSRFDGGAAIRGGIPVIFPQFALLGPLQKHGFARTSEWSIVASSASEATLRLRDSPATLSVWPHPFVAELTVRLGAASIDVALSVVNSGRAPFEFTAALHSYIRVDDVRGVRVRGLDGLRYRDSAAANREGTERAPELAIEGEVDRIYFDAADPIEVREAGRVTRAIITGFRDVVIWNPGPGADTTMPDMEPGGYSRMLCVEAAAIGTPLHLEPGARWSGAQTLAVA